MLRFIVIDFSVLVPDTPGKDVYKRQVQSVYDQCVTEGICTADEIKEMQDIIAKA